jgi:carboxymethylenebutenolidase
MIEIRGSRAGRARRCLAAALAVAVLGALAPSAFAGMVTFTQGDQHVSAYLALPKGAGTHPALIAIQEWWGLNDWVKQQSDSLAKHGYLTLAVDLYDGHVTNDPLEAHQLMSGLDDAAVVAKLKAATDYLRSRSDVRANAIGVIGWCLGGKYSIRLAAADPGIRACVMYYGAPLTDPGAIDGIQAAVLGNFGAEDQGPTPEQVRTFEKALRKAGKTVDFKIYPGAGHAFANVNNPWHGYRAAAAKDAWKRTLAFLNADLRRPSIPKHLPK